MKTGIPCLAILKKTTKRASNNATQLLEVIMYYLIDVGSKSIKLYQKNENDINQVEKLSYTFSNTTKASVFSQDGHLDICADDQEMLYTKFAYFINKYNLNRSNTKIYF